MKTTAACRCSILLLSLAILGAHILTCTAITDVNIGVTGGKLVSMTPGKLSPSIDYAITITVQNEAGDPVGGAKVGLAARSAVKGVSSGVTGSNGKVTLSVQFTRPGVVVLVVDGSTVGSEWLILYQQPPLEGLVLFVGVVAVITALMIWAIYVGPVRWMTRK